MDFKNMNARKVRASDALEDRYLMYVDWCLHRSQRGQVEPYEDGESLASYGLGKDLIIATGAGVALFAERLAIRGVRQSRHRAYRRQLA